MSGVAVVRYLLGHYAPLTAVIPDERIIAGDVTLNTARPCIAVTQVSSSDFRTLSRNGATRLVTERVQVSAIFDSQYATTPGSGYPGLLAAMKLVAKACPNQRAIINGIAVDSISIEEEGPDLFDSALALYSRSRDFFVRYWEAP